MFSDHHLSIRCDYYYINLIFRVQNFLEREREGNVSEDVVYLQIYFLFSRGNQDKKPNFSLKYHIYLVCLKTGVTLDHYAQSH